MCSNVCPCGGVHAQFVETMKKPTCDVVVATVAGMMVPETFKQVMEGGLVPIIDSVATDLVNTNGKHSQVHCAASQCACALADRVLGHVTVCVHVCVCDRGSNSYLRPSSARWRCRSRHKPFVTLDVHSVGASAAVSYRFPCVWVLLLGRSVQTYGNHDWRLGSDAF